MARRQIGKAMVYVTATDRETDDRRWIYKVRITVGRKRLWEGEVYSQPGGVRVQSPAGKLWVGLVYGDKIPDCGWGERLVALDSPAAFDAIARSAIRLNSVFLAEQPDPPIEVADAINEATLEALDENEQYIISRRF